MRIFDLHPWLLVPLSFALSMGTALLLIPLARRWGWVDHPDARKVHLVATPLVGGIAIYLAIAVTAALSPVPEVDSTRFHLALLLGGLLLLLTGLIDDLRGLTATLRFLLQIVACLLLIRLTGVKLDDFGPLFTAEVLHLGWLSVPITVFAAMGVINSFNLTDGMDGLAGGIFLIAAAGMAGFAVLGGQPAMAWLLLLAIAAVAGFLLLNARLPWNDRARAFLGDAGSLLLGFLLAWSFIRLGNGPDGVFLPMTAVWLYAVPLLDTTTLMWMRWREGRSPFAADQRHLHHAFLRAGYTVGETWVAIMLLAVVLGGIGILFEVSGLPGYASFYAFMLFAFTYLFYLRHSWASQRFFRRHFIHHDFTVEEGFVPTTGLRPAERPSARNGP